MPGSSTIQVGASDDDSNNNGRIVYSIESGDPHGNFSIDVDSGLVSTRTKLDREKMDSFDLIIYAVDHVSYSGCYNDLFWLILNYSCFCFDFQ